MNGNPVDYDISKSGLIILLFTTTILAISCANVGFPPGGPVDRTPPTIVDTFPFPASLKVDRNVTVSITFSERVDRRSVEETLFIAPNPGKNLRLKWKGKRLVICFTKPLRPDQTYVITIGTSTRDLRGNHMKESFSLAFSTGDHLDRGVISGRVYGVSNPQEVSIWGYFLEQDELDPRKIFPDYVTQCDLKGRFQFSNLALRNYRIFAIIDRDKNLLYTPGYDAIGVPSKDVSLSPSKPQSKECLFRVAVHDTTKLSLLGISVPDRRHLELRCNKPVDAVDVVRENFTLYSDSLQRSLPIQAVYLDRQNPVYIHFVVDLPCPGEYQLLVRRLRDQFGNVLPVDRAKIKFVKATINPDTLHPRLLSFYPPDSTRNLLPNESLELIFSEAMDSVSVETNFWVLDSANALVAGKFEWLNPAVVQFRPWTNNKQSGWVSRMAYRVFLRADSVCDISGNCLGDSLLNWRFWVVNQDTLSSISGVVKDEDPAGVGKIFLTATQVKGGKATTTIRLDSLGSYEFSYLLPGIYTIEGFRDADGNGRYSLGKPYPFIPAERFVVYPDSIAVRARWPNEGNDIIFRND